MGQLDGHQLDVVLSNRPVRREEGQRWRCRRIARQGVSIEDLEKFELILPGPNNELRTEFDALCERLEVQVRVMAEVDDMATLRLAGAVPTCHGHAHHRPAGPDRQRSAR